MIKICVVDDHPVVRQGLRKIVDGERDMDIICEAACYSELLERLEKTEPDIIILDLNLPGTGGLDILKELKVGHPDIPVLILTIHKEEHFAVRTLKAGADGFLNKMSVSDDLVKAVRKVVGGGKYISPKVAEILAAEVEKPTGGLPHERLSDREFQVLRLIASGKTTSEIAAMLELSSKTVGTYRERLLDKMKMKNNIELTYYAVKNGLIE